MPSMVKAAKGTVLSARQKKLVTKIRKAGFKPVMYKRAGNARGWSVHNPFLDVQRKAKVPKFRPVLASKYPQAYDTARQARVRKPLGRKLAKKKKVLPALKGLFAP